MCDFFSGIITKTGRVLTDSSNSHSTIIRINKLDDTKKHEDFLLFEIKIIKDANEYSTPTKNNWNLEFESMNGTNKFSIPTWYKASFDRKIWDVFKKVQYERIKGYKKKIIEQAKLKKLREIPQFTIALAVPEYLKDSIFCIKEVINEAVLRVNKDKIEILEIDPANVAMVKLTILNSIAVEWKVPREFEIPVNLTQLYNVLFNIKKHDMIVLESYAGNQFGIIIKGRSCRHYTIPTNQVGDYKKQKYPDLTFDTNITMPSYEFYNQMEEAENISDSVVFNTEGSIFELTAESDVKLRIPNKVSDDINIHCKNLSRCKYSLEYLTKFSKCKKLFDMVKIEYKTDYPLKVTYALIDKLSIEWILVPRVEKE